MKFKLLKENSIIIAGMFYSLISIIFIYLLFSAIILGVAFYILWNLGVSPVFGISGIDYVVSCLATLSIFSIFNFAHINILKENKKREGTTRYSRYNLLLNILLKIFIYLFAVLPFIILWNYAIPHIFSLKLIKINLFQTLFFIIAIRFVFGIIFYSISKDVSSSKIANNIGEIFIDWLNGIYPKGTYVVSNKDLVEKTGDLDYIENFCQKNNYVYLIGSTSTEYVAILSNQEEKQDLEQIKAVSFKEDKNTDWYKFCSLEDKDMMDLDIIEFNIYKCVKILIN